LHKQVDVDADDEAAAVAVGLAIVDQGGKRVFRQPCPKFSCGACSIHAARPAVCREYRCKLLKNVEEGHLGAAEAREKIAIAKTLIETVAGAVPDGATAKSRAELSQRLKTVLPRMEGLEREEAVRTLLDIGVLEHFLDRWFRNPKRNRTQAEGASEAVS
jgi:Fe-S-cluster containining protein